MEFNNRTRASLKLAATNFGDTPLRDKQSLLRFLYVPAHMQINSYPLPPSRAVELCDSSLTSGMNHMRHFSRHRLTATQFGAPKLNPALPE